MNITSTYQALANNQISSDTIQNLINTIISTINNFLTSLMPDGELWLVFGVSLLLSYRVKRQSNSGMLGFVFMVWVFWSFFRYYSIGG